MSGDPPRVEKLAVGIGAGVEAVRQQFASKHPIGHLGEADDVAWGIVYVASEEAKFVTVYELVIDGGYTAQRSVNRQEHAKPKECAHLASSGIRVRRWQAVRGPWSRSGGRVRIVDLV